MGRADAVFNSFPPCSEAPEELLHWHDWNYSRENTHKPRVITKQRLFFFCMHKSEEKMFTLRRMVPSPTVPLGTITKSTQRSAGKHWRNAKECVCLAVHGQKKKEKAVQGWVTCW